MNQRLRGADRNPFDFSNQRWIVTGASGGIGEAIALAANAAGAYVIAIARNPEKLQALKVQARAPERMQLEALDLSSLKDLQSWVDAQPPHRVNVLVNNVGALLNQYQQTAEGLEQSLATNLLGHVLLTDALKAHALLAADSSVINMSSGGMYGMRLCVEELFAGQGEYEGMAAYAMHKRAQVAMTGVWSSEWQADHSSTRAYVMHPGWVDTDGVRSSLPWFRAVLKRFLRTPTQAADTVLWLASKRPQATEGIWLDRILDPIHAFSMTKTDKPTPIELANRLRQVIAQVIAR
jgi:dehydrogenase/reductase SDR family member 12